MPQSMRISNFVIASITVEEVTTGKFSDIPSFIENFLIRYFEGWELKRAPCKHLPKVHMRAGKTVRSWIIREDLLDKIEVQVIGPGLYRSTAAFLNNILTRYYRGEKVQQELPFADSGP